jgi:hypothetical protein
MMAEYLMVEIVRLCRERLGIRFLQPRRGIVRSVEADGTCTVDAWGGQIPKVRVMQPWPGCVLSFQKGADVLLAWPRISGDTEDAAAPGQMPVIVGFYTGTSVSVDILTGGTAAARVGDNTVVDISSDPTYVAWVTAVDAFLRIVAPSLPPAPYTVSGKIVTGSTKVRIG